jgi:hypothetical protein
MSDPITMNNSSGDVEKYNPGLTAYCHWLQDQLLTHKFIYAVQEDTRWGSKNRTWNVIEINVKKQGAIVMHKHSSLVLCYGHYGDDHSSWLSRREIFLDKTSAEAARDVLMLTKDVK